MQPRTPPVIGLTGAVGAGKSTAAAAFAEAGCRVIDVDRMGHDALDAPAVRAAVAALLGPSVIAGGAGPGGALDRAAVARAVFGSPERLAALEAIVHPVVGERLRAELARRAPEGCRAVVIDCALLFEGGLAPLCDVTICVRTEESVRRRRIATSRGWSDEETRRREAAQLPAEEKAARAGRVVENDGSPAALVLEIGRLLDELAPADTPAVRRVSG